MCKRVAIGRKRPHIMRHPWWYVPIVPCHLTPGQTLFRPSDNFGDGNDLRGH
ncbi:MAG: hypothetical protein ABF566_08885 [Acetobacter sp.]